MYNKNVYRIPKQTGSNKCPYEQKNAQEKF